MTETDLRALMAQQMGIPADELVLEPGAAGLIASVQARLDAGAKGHNIALAVHEIGHLLGGVYGARIVGRDIAGAQFRIGLLSDGSGLANSDYWEAIESPFERALWTLGGPVVVSAFESAHLTAPSTEVIWREAFDHPTTSQRDKRAMLTLLAALTEDDAPLPVAVSRIAEILGALWHVGAALRDRHLQGLAEIARVLTEGRGSRMLVLPTKYLTGLADAGVRRYEQARGAEAVPA